MEFKRLEFFHCSCGRIFPQGVEDFIRELEEMGVEFDRPAPENSFVPSEHTSHTVEKLEPFFETFWSSASPDKRIGRVSLIEAKIPSSGKVVIIRKTRRSLDESPVYEVVA